MAFTNPPPRGDDNEVPIKEWDSAQNLNMLWKHWGMQDIWMGSGNAAGKYIPKVLDYVEDTAARITYQVMDLDDVYKPTLERVTPRPIADLDSEDVLLSDTRDSFRVWVDKSVFPHRLQVDGRTYVNARNARFASVFRGNPYHGTAEVVSIVLDPSGQVIDTKIPLELSTLATGQNVNQYYVPTAYTKHDLKNNEMCYVEFYSAEGHFLSSKELRVIESNFVRNIDRSLRSVIGIALESPLMSKTVPGLLEVPLNLTLNSLNLTGVVNYNSGTPVRRVVDGNKFSINGMDAYIPSQPGQESPMFLKYVLAPDEVALRGGGISPDRSIQEPIIVKTVDVDPSITAMLYAYPVWVNQSTGYRLQWYMLNLDRNMLYDVTGLVELGPNSDPFRGLLYGQRQDLNFVLNLQKVNSQFRAWNHIQTVGITLFRDGNATGTKWSIAFTPNQNPVYGMNIAARTKMINQNLSNVDISNGFATQEEWLEALYYNTKPIFNPRLEGPERPIPPDHFVLMHGNSETKYPLDRWDKVNQILGTVAPNSTLFVKFVRQGVNRDMILTVAGLTVVQDLP